MKTTKFGQVTVDTWDDGTVRVTFWPKGVKMEPARKSPKKRAKR